MLLNNNFSKKNNYLYKMKCLNTRNMEYYEEDNIDYNRVERNIFVNRQTKK